MTDKQQPFTPPQGKDLLVFGGVVYRWWEEACKRPPSSFYEKLDYVAAKAAEWGWQERDASVPSELQKARDEELEACCEWLKNGGCHTTAIELGHARRPKPKSLAEEGMEAMASMGLGPVFVKGADANAEVRSKYRLIWRALERLQELEGQGDD